MRFLSGKDNNILVRGRRRTLRESWHGLNRISAGSGPAHWTRAGPDRGPEIYPLVCEMPPWLLSSAVLITITIKLHALFYLELSPRPSVSPAQQTRHALILLGNKTSRPNTGPNADSDKSGCKLIAFASQRPRVGIFTASVRGGSASYMAPRRCPAGGAL